LQKNKKWLLTGEAKDSITHPTQAGSDNKTKACSCLIS